MDNKLSFKQKLNQVFDDKRHTRVWHNILDWAIIGLILISSLEVFLSTFSGLSENVGGIIKFIDVFTTVVFTIEVSLRIWAADELDSKYCGFKGRLKYCFSFYGLIDALSTYPAFFGLFFSTPLAVLKIFRVARLLRVFRFMKSFRLLGIAISSKKRELGISLAFLSILTLILSFLLFFAEHEAQPDLYPNAWKTIVWSFAKYLGDPGKMADFPLITSVGKLIATIVGILGIAIFAVPAGLISSGFMEAINMTEDEERIMNNIKKIHHAFRWDKDQHFTGLHYVPPFKPVVNLIVSQHISENDIIEAVHSSSDLHLYNLARAFNTEDFVPDRLAVVTTFRNTTYGCCIDRGSKVTIVSTSGNDEPITTWAAYHIAKFGGFNFVSKDFNYDNNNPVSFYNIKDETATPYLIQYLDDIEKLSSRADSWVIPMCFCVGPKSRQSKAHFCYSPVRGDQGYESENITITDTDTFEKLYNDFSLVLKDKYNLICDRNQYYPLTPATLMNHLKCENGFTLRFECEVIYFASDKLSKIMTISDILSRNLEPDCYERVFDDLIERPENCYGYDEYRD